VSSRLFYLAGLDGSGKTTQAEGFVDANQPGWTYRWVRWEPFLTRPLMAFTRFLLGGRRDGRGTARPTGDDDYVSFTAGKQQIFKRRFFQEVWTLVVLLEYLPQAWWRLGPPLFAGRRVLCDRYLPDLWVDLAMNFDSGPEGIRRLQSHPLCRLFPRPKKMIYLDVDPRVGFERKMDGTPLAALQDRHPLYLFLTRILPSREIDANRTTDDVAGALRIALIEADEGEERN